MTDNPFTEAVDAAEEEQATEATSSASFDTDRYYDALNSKRAPKNKTIGIAVTEEMHAFYQELQNADDVETNVTQSIRDHLENLANRHPAVFEKAMRKLEIEREF